MARVTVLATSDVHGHLRNWDYFAAEASPWGNPIGLARLSSIVDAIRAQQGAQSVVVLDNGDMLQGSQLSYLYSSLDGEQSGLHPIAVGLNTLGVDAVGLGNHEFSYGRDLLAHYAGDLTAPLVCANLVDAADGEPVFLPWTMLHPVPTGSERPLALAVIGLTTPGSMIWDRDVLGKDWVIEDLVSSAARWVPVARDAGAEAVVLLCHAGLGPSSHPDGTIPPENAAERIALAVSGVDAVVLGHTHHEISELRIAHQVTGADVVYTQPGVWGTSISRIDFELADDRGRWRVTGVAAETTRAPEVVEDPTMLRAIDRYHDRTLAYLDLVAGECGDQMSTAASHWQPTPILDLVHRVQRETAMAALAAADIDLPVVSITSPYSREASIDAGPVTVGALARLYIYDHSLRVAEFTGRQLRDYLEHSARYYAALADADDFDPEVHTAAIVGGHQIWDFDADQAAGVSYRIDLSQPVGARITQLTWPAGRAVEPGERLAVAINDYRRNGGGGFPHIADAPELSVGLGPDRWCGRPAGLGQVRELLIDWMRHAGRVDPAELREADWGLVCRGVPVRRPD